MTETETVLTRLDPREWKKPSGYANGVVVPAGCDLLFVAGQIGWDAEQRLVGLDEVNPTRRLAQQFDKALENICAVLEEGATGPSNICRMTVYVTDKKLYLAALKEIGASWKRLIGRHYPAMTLVEVADLLEKGALVEIEATAAVPQRTEAK